MNDQKFDNQVCEDLYKFTCMVGLGLVNRNFYNKICDNYKPNACRTTRRSKKKVSKEETYIEKLNTIFECSDKKRPKLEIAPTRPVSSEEPLEMPTLEIAPTRPVSSEEPLEMPTLEIAPTRPVSSEEPLEMPTLEIAPTRLVSSEASLEMPTLFQYQ